MRCFDKTLKGKIMNRKNRESAFELLRILSILGIITMHALAPICWDPAFSLLSVVENGIFQIGVTCFILISGYFGIRRSTKKLFQLESIALFGSVLGLVLMLLRGEGVSMMDLLRTCFPVLTGKWWFLTCYVCILLVAPFLNKFLASLTQKQWLELLGILIILFYIAPTFLYFQIMNDSGKGLMNFLTIYLIGRYLRIYGIKRSRWFWATGALLMLAANILLNIAFREILGRIELPFARDNSIFILLQGLCVFQFVGSLHFHSVWVNRIASFTYPAYILNSAVVLPLLPPLTKEYLLDAGGAGMMALLIVGTVVVTFVLSILIELIRRLFFTRFEEWLCPKVEWLGKMLIKHFYLCIGRWI